MTDSVSSNSQNKGNDQPPSVGKVWWDVLKSIRRWIVPAGVVAILGIVTAILALSPKEWATKLGGWGLFLKENAFVALLILFGLFVLFVVLLLRMLSRAYAREYASLLSKLKSPGEVKNFGLFPPKFRSLYDTREKMKDILHEFSKTEELKEIKVITATGGAIIPLFKDYVRSDRPIGNISVQTLLMDPSCPQIRKAAGHWLKEASKNIEESFPELNDELTRMGKNIQFNWKTYDFFPCVQGGLFGETHLFIGWMEWVKVGEKMDLRGAERQFLYFKKDDENAEYFFRLFRSWFNYAWNVKP